MTRPKIHRLSQLAELRVTKARQKYVEAARKVGDIRRQIAHLKNAYTHVECGDYVDLNDLKVASTFQEALRERRKSLEQRLDSAQKVLFELRSDYKKYVSASLYLDN